MRSFSNLFNPTVITLFFLGFASGLPIALTSSTLSAWYTEAGISLIGISALSLIGQPYIYKVFWAPLMDRYTLPFLGRRRGWILVTQLLLIVAIIIMSLQSPQLHPVGMAFSALLVTFFSASQDITISAYLTEAPSEALKGLSASSLITGYRIAVIVSGALALILAESLGWHITYMIMAGLMLIGVITTLLCKEPDSSQNYTQQSGFYHNIILPFTEFFQRKGLQASLIIIMVMIIYKLGDAFALTLNTVFFLKDLHFSLSQVGVVNKGIGMTASILGGILGGLWMTKLNLYRSLIIFGIIQALANLSFMVLAMIGHHLPALMITVFIENFGSGLSNTAFVVLIMNMCNKQFSATQYALFSALASLGRVYVGPAAGVMVEHWGWVWFYFSTFVIALPGVALLPLIKRHLIN